MKHIKPSDESRRTFLKGVGSAALVPVLADISPIQAASIETWDQQTDVVVIGSGAAGFSAALFAHNAGAKVIMLEKGPVAGGTTARSGGVSFIPNNHLLREAGKSDPKEDFLRFVIRVSYPGVYHPDLPRFGAAEDDFALLEAYYDNAAETAEGLVDMKAVNFITLLDHDNEPFADNFPELAENRCPRGRAICCQPGTIQEGRYYYPNNGGFGIDLIHELQSAATSRGIAIKTRHEVKNIVVNSAGEVIGVVAQTRNGEQKIGAQKGVVFGSGGFVHNKKLRDHYLRGVVYGGCATPMNQGDFLRIAGGLGASVGNLDSGWWVQILLEDAIADSDVLNGVWVIPGDSSLLVNRNGERFCDEKNLERSKAQSIFDPVTAQYTNQVGIMIWDQRCADLYPGLYGIQPKEGELPKHVIVGSNLAELEIKIAARLKQFEQHTGNTRLDDSFGSKLETTIERYNTFAKTGNDGDFNRGAGAGDRAFHFYGGVPHVENPYPNELMHPLASKGPYFAALIVAGVIDSKGGPRVNTNGQVINTHGEPISGLYGAGNCISSPTADTYWGAGGTIGPAIVFGKIAGSHAARSPSKSLAGKTS